MKRNGAHIIFAPLIRIVPPRTWRPLERALNSLIRYDAVVFTSVNAVDAFFKRLKKKPFSPRVLAAVGHATCHAVSVHGYRCSVVPEDARSAGLTKALRVPRGARVLIPRAERGLNLLPNALRKKGVLVTVVPVYRTLPDQEGRRALRRALIDGADAVLFASGSAARLGASDVKLSGAVAVAIGPTTAAVLRSRGVRPAAVSKRPDPKSFARAVVLALRGRP
ncbi:MAG: uroporphyrinogen-III synthase [Elusimicrobia bacterium]|nr:uroporphyrinogen-III synthase [Elusimicrobiota bacterium]